MFIHEAVAHAVNLAKGISRQAWGAGLKTYVIPTNGENCCLFVLTEQKQIARGWEPKAEDLTADDWEIVF